MLKSATLSQVVWTPDSRERYHPKFELFIGLLLFFDHDRVCPSRGRAFPCAGTIRYFQFCCSRKACPFLVSLFTYGMARTVATVKARPNSRVPRAVEAAMKKQFWRAVDRPPFCRGKYDHYCKSVADGSIESGHPDFASTLVKISAYRAWQRSAGIKARTTQIMTAVNTALHTTCGICWSAECDGMSCNPYDHLPGQFDVAV